MKQLKCVSLFYLNENILGKDMFLAPYYIADKLNASFEYVFPYHPENAHIMGCHRGTILSPIKSLSRYNGSIWTEKEMFFWLVKNAKKIDLLTLFWLTPRNIFFANVYKLLNPKGVCYIKGDMNEKDVFVKKNSNPSIRDKIKNYLINAVDVFSVETISLFNQLQKGFLGSSIAKKVAYCPNGFDSKLFTSYNIPYKQWSEKSNLIISVGRIGSVEKNSEMVLKALEGVDLGEWTFLFIGPVENNFNEKLSDFLSRNPKLNTKIRCHGITKDKKELWELYNSAKVFVLTSPKEGFPNVFSEALFFNNYIISTDVSSASDITKDGTIGTIIPINDVDRLRTSLLEVINDSSKILRLIPSIKEHASQFIWMNAVNNVADKICEQMNEKYN